MTTHVVSGLTNGVIPMMYIITYLVNLTLEVFYCFIVTLCNEAMLKCSIVIVLYDSDCSLSILN
jgi:hypothetical protein